MQNKTAIKRSTATARGNGTQEIEIKIVWTLPPGRVKNLQRPDSEQAKTKEAPALTQNDAHSGANTPPVTRYE